MENQSCKNIIFINREEVYRLYITRMCNFMSKKKKWISLNKTHRYDNNQVDDVPNKCIILY